MDRLDPDSDPHYDALNQSPRHVCEDCELDGEESPVTSGYDMPWGIVRLCERHASRRQDQASERSDRDDYGGESPRNEAERTLAAHQAKRGER